MINIYIYKYLWWYLSYHSFSHEAQICLRCSFWPSQFFPGNPGPWPMACHHLNWRFLIFFWGVGRKTTNQILFVTIWHSSFLEKYAKKTPMLGIYIGYVRYIPSAHYNMQPICKRIRYDMISYKPLYTQVCLWRYWLGSAIQLLTQLLSYSIPHTIYTGW